MWFCVFNNPEEHGSLSARRAWIEIPLCRLKWSIRLWSLSARRAWIEIISLNTQQRHIQSLSARRAWIEIFYVSLELSFDRWSLSARRAWIEIRLADMSTAWHRVALRKESVDRNQKLFRIVKPSHSRSPQGERG